MDRSNPRQRIRQEETCYRGKDGSFAMKKEEHSVFMADGNIISRERIETPVTQGIIPHEPTDVAGQCLSCLDFTTELLICDLCWEVVCLHCASQRTERKVCPACARYLERRRWILILRKLFIEPFVERIG